MPEGIALVDYIDQYRNHSPCFVRLYANKNPRGDLANRVVLVAQEFDQRLNRAVARLRKSLKGFNSLATNSRLLVVKQPDHRWDDFCLNPTNISGLHREKTRL